MSPYFLMSATIMYPTNCPHFKLSTTLCLKQICFEQICLWQLCLLTNNLRTGSTRGSQPGRSRRLAAFARRHLQRLRRRRGASARRRSAARLGRGRNQRLRANSHCDCVRAGQCAGGQVADCARLRHQQADQQRRHRASSRCLSGAFRFCVYVCVCVCVQGLAKCFLPFCVAHWQLFCVGETSMLSKFLLMLALVSICGTTKSAVRSNLLLIMGTFLFHLYSSFCYLFIFNFDKSCM